MRPYRQTFSRIVCQEKSRSLWGIYAKCPLTPVNGTPSTSISPASGVRLPESRLRMVDLPPPDAPRMLTNSCGITEKDRSRRTSLLP